jgi:hypothetical protein
MRLNRDFPAAASHAKVVGHAGRLAPKTPEQPLSDVVHLPSAERLLRDRLERAQNTAASVAAIARCDGEGFLSSRGAASAGRAKTPRAVRRNARLAADTASAQPGSEQSLLAAA